MHLKIDGTGRVWDLGTPLNHRLGTKVQSLNSYKIGQPDMSGNSGSMTLYANSTTGGVCNALLLYLIV